MYKVVFICAALPNNINYLKSALLYFEHIKIYIHEWYHIRKNQDGKFFVDQLKFEPDVFVNSLVLPVQEGFITIEQSSIITEQKVLTKIAHDILAKCTNQKIFDQIEYQDEILALRDMLQFSISVDQQLSMKEIETYYAVQLKTALYSLLKGENIFFTSKIIKKIFTLCSNSIISDIKKNSLSINFDTFPFFPDEDKTDITNVSVLSFDDIIKLRHKLKYNLSDFWFSIKDRMDKSKYGLDEINRRINILQMDIKKNLRYQFPKLFLLKKNVIELVMLLNNLIFISELSDSHFLEKTVLQNYKTSKVYSFYMCSDLNEKQDNKSINRKIEELGLLMYKNSKTLIPFYRECIFLSYSSKDVEWVRKISNAFQKHGFNIWLDRVEMDLINDDDIVKTVVSNGIENSDIFVVLLSLNSISSKWVEFEIKYASNAYQQGKIKSLVVAIVDNIEIPFELDNWELADFSIDFESAIWCIRQNIDYIEYTKRKDSDSCSTAPKNNNTVNFKEISPDSTLIYNQGITYLNHNEYESAIRCFDKAFTKDERNCDALYNSAVLRYDLAIKEVDSKKKAVLFQRVINDYEKLLIVNPSDVDAMVNLVASYRNSNSRANTYQKQLNLLNKALEIRPDYYLVWENMGYFYLQIDNYQKLNSKENQISMKGSFVRLDFKFKAKQCFIDAAYLSNQS